MADNTGTAVGTGVGAVGGSLFGPVGTAAGGFIGGAIGSLFNGGSPHQGDASGNYQNATSQEMQEANANQAFWNEQYANFNPQSQAITSQPSGQAYSNIANNAKSMFGNNPNGGPTGNVDQNQVGQNLQTKGQSASNTQDINNFLKDTQQNQQTAEQRELSMFSNSQGQNQANANLKINTPNQEILNNAKAQSGMGDAWNDYNTNQPNTLNVIGGAAGGAAGKILGSQASASMFKNNGSNNNTNNNAADEGDVTDLFNFNS